MHYYKPHMKLFITDLVAAILVAVIGLVFPIISRAIVNDYIPDGNLQMIGIMVGVAGLLYVVEMGMNYFIAYWGHVMGARMEYDMRADLFRHLQTLSFSYYDENKTGQIMARLTSDLREIAELAHHGPEDLFISVLMLGGSCIILMTINIPLTLVMMFLVTIIIAFSVSRRKKMRDSFRSVRAKHAEINANIENSISGIRLSQSFTNEDFEIAKFDKANLEHCLSRNESYRNMGIFMSGNNFLIKLLNIAIIGFGGVLTYNGQINFGDLLAFILYTNFFVQPIRRLIQFTSQFQSGMAGFERFLEVMDENPDIKDAYDVVDVTELDGSIAIKDITFAYEKDQEAVLKNFSLAIPKGKNVALVGSSGVGKTTIASLVPRFYDVNEGSICVDGYDIKKLPLKTLRGHIGIVQQDVFIFYGTIRDNISYGLPGSNHEAIIEAAKAANIHDFIMSLDYGYDTIVGERGIKLSGGQKQRIAIARVFLKNPPILILDEATSALDNENEQIIQASIERLSQNRTSITIAHRLSTIKNADEIVVLAKEGIIERGPHDELLEQGGVYASLYHAQFKGFIPDAVREV